MTSFLVIQHEDNCGPAWLGQWWREAGAQVHTVAADREPVPASAAGYDALVVLGGSMGATQDDVAGWLPAVRALIAQTILNDEVPFLGVCLGHQLAAVALGGEVGRHERLTLGLTPVGVNVAGRADPLLGVVPPGAPAIQYNHDHVTRPPAGAQVLASAPDEHIQALRYGPRAWGVQFHPECAPAGFDAWTVDKDPNDPDRAELDAYGVEARAAAIHAAEADLVAAWRPFATRFAQIAGGTFHLEGAQR